LKLGGPAGAILGAGPESHAKKFEHQISNLQHEVNHLREQAKVAEKEAYKRALNKKLIHMMITEIPGESKHCVSYGQLKGCYWTIPATSTQGTTREDDKDYIARVSVSPDLDLKRHKAVFAEFVEGI
jgi:hypothetical protein